jgi:hypothetical protein
MGSSFENGGGVEKINPAVTGSQENKPRGKY